MENRHHIVCGGLDMKSNGLDHGNVHRLNLWNDGSGMENVKLHIEDINQKLLSDIPDEFSDLLEIATYVYCADQAIRRGAYDVPSFGANWRRYLHLHVPVRRLGFWKQSEVERALVETLDFLSDDFYSFTFYGTQNAPGMQRYLGYADSVAPMAAPEEVILFSGGLDSLAGAIESAIVQKNQVILVNHRPTPKLGGKHRELQNLLVKKTGELKPIHMNVRINKDRRITKETTQRSRSFLYAAIGATVAEMVGLRSISFYENGVVGLNLPVCAQVVGGRATRTAHPRVLAGFKKILSLVSGKDFEVKNPFVWKTRGDLIKQIVDADCGGMIAPSISCAHTWEMSNAQTHCGVCSQCIDRRMGIIAAGAEGLDPIDQYRKDFFTESFSKDEDKMMAATYVERANTVESIQDFMGLVEAYPAVMDALPFLEGTAAKAASRVLDLYRRHANEVTKAIDTVYERNVSAMRKRTLPGDCLLRIVTDPNSTTIVPAERIDANRRASGKVGEVKPDPEQDGKSLRAAKRKPKKREQRAGTIDGVKTLLREHIRTARDHAYTTKEKKGIPKLLPRPTQEYLAEKLKVDKSSISRAIRDIRDSETKILWEMALDVDKVMNYRR